MKAECWWCGDPQGIAKHGMIYLHRKCFDAITDHNDDLEYCVKYAKGELPKFKANGDREGYESFKAFLISMHDFRRRWKNTENLIAKLTNTDKKTIP